MDSGFFPVLAIKSGKVSEFSGKFIGTISTTQLFIDPDIPEAHSLRNWFDHGGKNVAFVSIYKENMPAGSKNEMRKTARQIKDEGLGRSDKPDWMTTIKVTMTFVKSDYFCYTVCPLTIRDRKCCKKVNRLGNNRWLCDRCNQEFRECDYRYLLQAQEQNHTGVTWVTAFQEARVEILGLLAKELYRLKENNDDRFALSISTGLSMQFLFRLKVKKETYGEEQRVKVTMVKAEKLDYSLESRLMLDLITKYTRK